MDNTPLSIDYVKSVITQWLDKDITIDKAVQLLHLEELVGQDAN